LPAADHLDEPRGHGRDGRRAVRLRPGHQGGHAGRAVHRGHQPGRGRHAGAPRLRTLAALRARAHAAVRCCASQVGGQRKIIGAFRRASGCAC
jgi:hypothetical protein